MPPPSNQQLQNEIATLTLRVTTLESNFSDLKALFNALQTQVNAQGQGGGSSNQNERIIS